LLGRGLRRGWTRPALKSNQALFEAAKETILITMTVKERVAQLSEKDLEPNLRAVDHAIAQQRLEGLTVSESTVEDMRRAARGEIPADEVIGNIYARFGHVTILKR
jgi:hypothetical protein